MKHLFFVAALSFALSGFAQNLKPGSQAPEFSLPNQKGEMFLLADRKNSGWTVLFFYPKAGTPGCTKQVCAFRDSIKAVREKNAEVYGISADSVEEQRKFHDSHNLLYPLLSDSKLEVITAYGVKMDEKNMAKRWTFILDPSLKVRWVDDKVDPVMDPKRVVEKLTELQQSKS